MLLEKLWQKHDAAIPAWFRTLQANGDDCSGVVAVIVSANASFSSADGGAAGASGGGSSGAG
jgi:hypothetical protein